ncbi:MAG TPA: hypothetical protein VF818_04595 [Ktedonobacterales bacterium]
MSESLVLLIGVWLLCLLVAVRCIARFSVARAERWHEAVPSIFTAEGRARALLREMLTDDEYEQLMVLGYLEVRSPTTAYRVYRIPASAGRVRMYERGRELVELCLQPTEPLPDSDLVLMHKLMIEANEQEYLTKANHFAPGTLAVIVGRL